MKALLHKFSIRTSFKREIFFGLLIASLIPVFIVCVLLVNISKSKIKNDYERKYALQLKSVLVTLNSYFEKINEITDSIIEDEKIVSNINKSDRWEQNKIYNRFYHLTDKLRDSASFNIYTAEGECIFSTESYEKSSGSKKYMPVYWGILKVASVHFDDFIIKKSLLSENEEVVLQTAKAIMNNDDCIGYVVTDIRTSDIESVIYKNFDSSNCITIVDAFYDEIYSSKSGTEKNIAKLFRDYRFNENSVAGNLNQSKLDFFIEDIADTQLTLILEKETVITDDMTQTMWGVSFTVGTFSLILCLLIASIFSSYMANPVNVLSKAMEQVQDGNLDISINSKRKDELGRLSFQFDNMTLRLKNYMELQVRQQKELNEANIAMMQAQLNPHFLYNTLDTIKWTSKLNNVPEISKMAADLAKILRMSISSKKFVLLTEELELVEKYIEIQQIRFGGNFTFDYELPMELEDCIVPKLVIQPIVENALIHGLKEQDKGQIFINILENQKKLIIEVSDDGCGIDEVICEKINNRNREDFKDHIGFYNVDTIIKLYYGKEYGIKVEKLSAGGTKVCLILPIQKKGDSLC